MQQNIEKKWVNCAKCGETNPIQNRHCAACGANLSNAEAQTQLKRLNIYMAAFQFSAVDLAYNAMGRLTPEQKGKIKRRQRTFTILWSIILMSFCLIFGIYSRSVWLGVASWVGLTAALAYYSHQRANRIISEEDFLSYRGEIGHFSHRRAKYLNIDGHSLGIHSASLSLIKRGMTYNVHYVPFFGGGLILSLVPADLEVNLTNQS